MKESIGYTVTLNIVITFIIIVFAFLCAILIYFKTNKGSNVIVDSIEKYEGYNELSIKEINTKLSSLYTIHDISSKCGASRGECNLVTQDDGRGKNGYCVYLCYEEDSDYYYYKVRTSMIINIPIVNNLVDYPIFTNTNRMFNYEHAFTEIEEGS